MKNQAFIGTKISLISRAGIRYEGILFSIDANNSTIALSQVTSHGTENRVVDKRVAARDAVFEYIIFRGSDINDLHVCEPIRDEMIQQDPAIVGISEKSQAIVENLKKKQSKDQKTTGTNITVTSGAPTVPANYQDDYQYYHYNYPQSSNKGNYYWMPKSSIGSSRMMSIYPGFFSKTASNTLVRNSKERQTKSGRKLPAFASKKTLAQHEWSESSSGFDTFSRKRSKSYDNNTKTKRKSKEYDYVTANKEIAKEMERLSTRKDPIVMASNGKGDILATTSGKPEDTATVKNQHAEPIENEQENANGDSFYDQLKSFYDNISSEAIDRSKGKSVRVTSWKEEQRLNIETFGITSMKSGQRTAPISSSDSSNFNFAGYQRSRKFAINRRNGMRNAIKSDLSNNNSGIFLPYYQSMGGQPVLQHAMPPYAAQMASYSNHSLSNGSQGYFFPSSSSKLQNQNSRQFVADNRYYYPTSINVPNGSTDYYNAPIPSRMMEQNGFY